MYRPSAQPRHLFGPLHLVLCSISLATPLAGIQLQPMGRLVLAPQAVHDARLTVAADGAALAVWTVAGPAARARVAARWLDPLGRPMGSTLSVAVRETFDGWSYVLAAVAARPGGRAAVAIRLDHPPTGQRGPTTIVPLGPGGGRPIDVAELGCLGDVPEMVATSSGYAVVCATAADPGAVSLRWLDRHLQPRGEPVPVILDPAAGITLAAGEGESVVVGWIHHSQFTGDHRRYLRWSSPGRSGPRLRLPSNGYDVGHELAAPPAAVATESGFLALFSRFLGWGLDEETTPIESAALVAVPTPHALGAERRVGRRSCVDAGCRQPRPLVDLHLAELDDARYLASWATAANHGGPGPGFASDTGELHLRIVGADGALGPERTLHGYWFRKARGYTGARLVALTTTELGAGPFEARVFRIVGP